MLVLPTPPLSDDERLPPDIAGLDRLVGPVWVFDPVAERKLYANRSAIELWSADDLAELRARDFSAKSEAARTRTEQTLMAVQAGETRTEVWTFYPKGRPVSVRAIASHLRLRDGSSGILFEASLLETDDQDYLRALDAVRQADRPISLYDEAGAVLFGNPHAVRTYGGRNTFLQRCTDAGPALAAWNTATSGGYARQRLSMTTQTGVICHEVTLQRTVDPLTGSRAMLSYEMDDTDKVAGEAHLECQIAALEVATAKAEAANEAKSVFLANMSHEIRTPLNGVVSLADLLCRSDLSGSQREAAELILASGRSLEQLLADVLQLAQIEAGEVTVVNAPFDLAGVARSVTDLMRLKAEESGTTLGLRIDLAAGSGRSGDALRIRQVLVNLVSNAIKFTSKGSVTVTLADHEEGVRILVEDTGIGFDEVQKNRLFERFQQADPSITRRFGGSGLGLAITAGLVHRMGGALGCDSVVGARSRFWADLPLPAVVLDGPAATGSDVSQNLQGLHVLVADDHPVNRRVIEMILGPLGVDVVSVENGAQAVDAVEHQPFDLVLMDMQMPVMDGLEATRKIVAAEGPPVVMVSANGMPEHVAAAIDAGAVAHVLKPVQPAVLIETVLATLHDDTRNEAPKDACSALEA